MTTLETIKSILATDDLLEETYAEYGEYVIDFNIGDECIATVKFDVPKKFAAVSWSAPIPRRGWGEHLAVMNRALAVAVALECDTGTFGR